MKAFLSIKFWGDDRNREQVEAIISAIEGAGYDVFCFRRDAEEWGKNRFTLEEMMRLTFEKIDRSHLVIADVTDWPIGVGVEAGYAHGKGVPVICICPEGKPVANTVAGIAKRLVKYEDGEDLKSKLISLDLGGIRNK
jgi:nucleoside 2-deoxyribosyltransferase